MAQKAVEIGYDIMNGTKPAEPMILMPSTLITRDNVKDYKGWSAPADATIRRRPAGPGGAALAFQGAQRHGRCRLLRRSSDRFVPTVTGTGLADAPAFVKAPGGAAANVAVGLARLGVPSAFMGKVGDDPFGHFLADTLAAEGIDVTPLRFEPRARTALAFVSLRADGEREFMFYRHPSADMLFRPDEVDEAAIRAASVFHFDSISLAAEQPRATVLHAATVAQAADRLISYDVNLRLPLWQDAGGPGRNAPGPCPRPPRQAQRRRAALPDWQPRAGRGSDAVARRSAAGDPEPGQRRLGLVHRHGQRPRGELPGPGRGYHRCR